MTSRVCPSDKKILCGRHRFIRIDLHRKERACCQFFLEEMASVPKLYLCATIHAEVILATMSLQTVSALNAMEGLINALNMETVDFCSDDVEAYKNAALKYHLKAKPPGPLNMGDVFSFQPATKMSLPLFFQGKDFLKTSVVNAMALLGYQMNEKNLGIPTKSEQTF